MAKPTVENPVKTEVLGFQQLGEEMVALTRAIESSSGEKTVDWGRTMDRRIHNGADVESGTRIILDTRLFKATPNHENINEMWFNLGDSNGGEREQWRSILYCF